MPETWRDRTTVTTQDPVAGVEVILVGYRTEITAEAKVREGEMVTTPTPSPHQDRHRMRGGMEVGRRKENEFIGGMDGNIFLRPYHRALTVRPCHRALTMINLDH